MRNTICATLTAITLILCTALAGCGSASKTSTPAHAIAATGTTCSEESSDERIKECIVTLSETRRSTASSPPAATAYPESRATGTT